MTGEKFYVYGEGRWREINLANGHVAGWGAVQFLRMRHRKLQVVRRHKVLRGLKSLAHGRPTSCRDGPRLSQIRNINIRSKEEDDYTNCSKCGCRPHCCHPQLCYRCNTDANFNSLVKPVTSHVAVQCTVTSTVGTNTPNTIIPIHNQHAAADIQQQRSSSTKEGEVREKKLTRKRKRSHSRDTTRKNLKQLNAEERETQGDSSESDFKLRTPLAERKSQEEEVELGKELEIAEEEILLIRSFIENDNRNIFGVDLERFDSDDYYKRIVFYKLNPLVNIEKNQQIIDLINKKKTEHALKVFLHNLGLQSLEEASQTSSNYRMRRRCPANTASNTELNKENISKPVSKKIKKPTGLTESIEKTKNRVKSNQRVPLEDQERMNKTMELSSESDAFKSKGRVIWKGPTVKRIAPGNRLRHVRRTPVEACVREIKTVELSDEIINMITSDSSEDRRIRHPTKCGAVNMCKPVEPQVTVNETIECRSESDSEVQSESDGRETPLQLVKRGAVQSKAKCKRRMPVELRLTVNDEFSSESDEKETRPQPVNSAERKFKSLSLVKKSHPSAAGVRRSERVKSSSDSENEVHDSEEKVTQPRPARKRADRKLKNLSLVKKSHPAAAGVRRSERIESSSENENEMQDSEKRVTQPRTAEQRESLKNGVNSNMRRPVKSLERSRKIIEYNSESESENEVQKESEERLLQSRPGPGSKREALKPRVKGDRHNRVEARRRVNDVVGFINVNEDLLEKDSEKRMMRPRQNPAASRSKEGGPRDYSLGEDAALVRLVRVGGRARLVNGNKLWKDMEVEYERTTEHFRSWHSLRNRYLRHLLPALGSSSLPLPPGEAARLRAAAAKGNLKSRKLPQQRNSIFNNNRRVISAWSRRPRSPPREFASPPPSLRSLRDAPSPYDDPSPSDDPSDSARDPSFSTSWRLRAIQKNSNSDKKRTLRSSAVGTPSTKSPASASRNKDARTPTYSEITKRFARKHSTPDSAKKLNTNQKSNKSDRHKRTSRKNSTDRDSLLEASSRQRSLRSSRKSDAADTAGAGAAGVHPRQRKLYNPNAL